MVQWIVVGVGAALLLNGGGAGAFATGQYRNLFAEAGHPPAQATAKIDAAFQQLFHGDPNTQTVYYPVGTNANGPLAYLTDVANYDGSPRNYFQADSWRVAMNWSVDWSWWAKDPREQVLSDRIQASFESKGLESYGNRFTLDGTQRDHSHSPGLVATNAVAGLAATDKDRARKFIEALWNTPIPSGRYRYYDGMLYLMSMLHCSGQFRIWPPPEQENSRGREEDVRKS
jgi:endo-1,4-beta-D-glucanase Y